MRTIWTAALVAAMVAMPGTALAGAGQDHGAKDKAGAKSHADMKTSKATTLKFAVVMVNDQEIFRLADSGGLTASQRAAKLEERLRSVLEPDPGEKWKSVQASDVTVESIDAQPIIRLRNQNVVAVTAQDAQVNRRKLQDLAQRWAEELRGALKEVKVAKGGKLPEGFVTVAIGSYEFAPKGGGAGAGTPPKEEIGPKVPMGPKERKDGK